MTPDDFDWQYDEESGLIVAPLDEGGQHLDLIIEDDTHPYVELWVWTRHQGWDHIETVQLGVEPDLDASKQALADWISGAVDLW